MSTPLVSDEDDQIPVEYCDDVDDDAHPEDDVDPFLGRRLAGKFEIEALVRTGAMGRVYRARHLPLDRTVCVKIMHPERAMEPLLVERFHREARLASQIDHPSSVAVIDFGEEADGTHYLAMEFLRGRDLYEVLEEDGPLARERIIRIMRQLLGALSAVHEAGILHRDLKPENVMIVSGNDGEEEIVKICDYGIAKVLGEDETDDDEVVASQRVSTASSVGRKLTRRGAIVGTPEYMSPEQARGDMILDRRSDLYAAGVLLYQMLTGQCPFDGDTPLGIALRHVSEEPKAPSTLRPDVDPILEAVCLKALKKNPAERWSNARDMRAALLGRRSAPLSIPVAIPASVDRISDPGATLMSTLIDPPRRRRTSRVVTALVTLLAIGGAAAFTMVRLRHDAHASTTTTTTITAATQQQQQQQQQAPLVIETSPPTITTVAEMPAFVPPPKPANLPAPAPIQPKRSSAATTPPAAAAAAAATAVEPPPAEPEPAPAQPQPQPPAAPPSTTTDPPAPEPPPAPAAAAAAAAPSSGQAQTPRGSSASAGVARVEIGAPTKTLGATASAVQRALAPANGKMTACYRTALTTSTLVTSSSERGTLQIETNDVGVITRARFDGALRPLVGGCIERSILGAKVPSVDTGSASADIPLAFLAR